MGTLSLLEDKSIYTFTTGDFLTDVALGAIPGLSTIPIVTGINPVLGNSGFEDIWDEGGLFAFPTSAESWEIVSDSANDTSAGTGLRTLLVTSLDADFNLQNSVVIMNGTSAVAVSGTHIRTNRMTGITSGSNATNVGNITLQVASGGNVRQKIRPDEGTSFSSFYTAPAGKTALIYQTFANTPKGEDAQLRSRVRINATNPTELTGGTITSYQDDLVFPLKTLGVFGEKTDFWIQGFSTNPSITVTVSFEIMEVDAIKFRGDVTALAMGFVI